MLGLKLRLINVFFTKIIFQLGFICLKCSNNWQVGMLQIKGFQFSSVLSAIALLGEKSFFKDYVSSGIFNSFDYQLIILNILDYSGTC